MVSAADGKAPCKGRRRDSSIDSRVLGVTQRHLSERGFAGLSLAAIAEEACTTRQAMYRRWPTKELLVAEAIRMSATSPSAPPADEAARTQTSHPRRDLERELEALMSADSPMAGMELAGAMMQSRTPDDARDCYRSHVLSPRRRRMLDILGRAQWLGQIDADADLEAAVAAAIGASYVARLNRATETDWPGRMAALVWRGLGGAPR
jgi:AcrR family transcriptional regulator